MSRVGGIFTQNFLKIAFVFAGTVIGAGFASGQEILQFFVKYGRFGVFGIFIAIAVFTLLSIVILCKIATTKSSNVSQYFDDGFPVWFKKTYNILSVLFMCASYGIMVTAVGQLFVTQFNMPLWVGVGIMNVVCVFCFTKGEEGIIGINKFLTPIIIVAVVLIFLCDNIKPVFRVDKIYNNVPVSSMVYVSYNTISLVAVLTSVSGLVKNKTTAVLASLTGGFALLVTALCIFMILKNSQCYLGEIPMLDAVGTKFKTLYCVILTFAIVTTAVSSGAGVINNMGINKTVTMLFLVVLSVLMCTAGFKQLIKFVYSAFGYLGFIIMLFTISDGIKFIK
ncbi:MAG: hypothetical protein IJC06_03350 [Clostridia bacterium]|nr:hypothetical protein [Clostridia bacterium]